MKKLIKFIAKAIVDNPDQIKIEEIQNDQTDSNQISLKVAPEDIGKIIGKQGRIIKALRNLIRVKSIIEGKRTFFRLKEEEKDSLYQ